MAGKRIGEIDWIAVQGASGRSMEVRPGQLLLRPFVTRINRSILTSFCGSNFPPMPRKFVRRPGVIE